MLTAVLALLVLSCALPVVATAAPNSIELENANPGTKAWQLGAAPSTQVQGYASEISLQPGDALHLHVSTTPAANYRVEIYRLGWYQGLGARRMACLPSCSGDEPGTQQPVPSPDPTTGKLDAGWPVSDSVTIGPNWTSGYFVAKLILTSGSGAGHGSYVPFIVRAAPGTPSAMLVQASVNTWQAYNNWGGKSLYAFNSSGATVPATGTNAAAMVSFNRPFGSDQNAGPLTWEYPLVRYLERHGYNVSYQTDVDTDLNPSSLLGHKLDVVSGHDEYWSKAMRDAWEAARGAGVNLAFLGGNIGYWQLRYADSNRTLVEYRSAVLDPNPDPATKTVAFRSLTPARPECSLLGVASLGGKINAPADPPRAFTVTSSAPSNPWFAGSGFAVGDTIPDSVGYEWDTYDPTCKLPPVQVLLHYSQSFNKDADAVTYQAPSGARVFSDGTMQLVWALEDYGHVTSHNDARMQRLFAKIFDDLSGATNPPAPFHLLSPANKAVLWTPRPTLSWSPSSDPGSALQAYVITLDGRPVASTNAISYALTKDLADGKHTWSVSVSNSTGLRSSTRQSAFTVQSARVVSHSRKYVLRHGFSVLVFCSGRCSVLVRIGLGKSLHLSATHHAGGPGLLKISVPLTNTFKHKLQQAKSAKLNFSVTTHAGRSARKVSFSLRW